MDQHLDTLHPLTFSEYSTDRIEALIQWVTSMFVPHYFYTLTTQRKPAAGMNGPPLAVGKDRMKAIHRGYVRRINEDECGRLIENGTLRLRNQGRYHRVWRHSYFSYVAVATDTHIHLVTDNRFRPAHVDLWPGRVKRQAQDAVTIRSTRGVLTYVFHHLDRGANLIGPWHRERAAGVAQSRQLR